jgi:hypothetical protein
LSFVSRSSAIPVQFRKTVIQTTKIFFVNAAKPMPIGIIQNYHLVDAMQPKRVYNRRLAFSPRIEALLKK